MYHLYKPLHNFYNPQKNPTYLANVTKERVDNMKKIIQNNLTIGEKISRKDVGLIGGCN